MLLQAAAAVGSGLAAGDLVIVIVHASVLFCLISTVCIYSITVGQQAQACCGSAPDSEELLYERPVITYFISKN